MADKYASVAGSGAHDGSSAANAWTIAEATAAVVAGDTVNVLAGTYIANDSASSAVMDLDVAGTVALWVIWRAYTSTINDFAEGDTPPVILDADTNTLANCVLATTLTGDAFNQFIGFQFTGASGIGVDGGTVTDQLAFMGCKFDSNGGIGFQADNELYLVGCEFTENTGGSLDGDNNVTIIRGKFHNESNATGIARINTGLVLNSTFYNLGASQHLRVQGGETTSVIGNTFDGDGNGSSTAVAVVGATTHLAAIYNNVLFDCNVGVDTVNLNFILNRGYNLFSNCTTDYDTLTNDPSDISNSTDPFTDSANRDYTLATGSAARAAGIDGGTP